MALDNQSNHQNENENDKNNLAPERLHKIEELPLEIQSHIVSYAPLSIPELFRLFKTNKNAHNAILLLPDNYFFNQLEKLLYKKELLKEERNFLEELFCKKYWQNSNLTEKKSSLVQCYQKAVINAYEAELKAGKLAWGTLSLFMFAPPYFLLEKNSQGQQRLVKQNISEVITNTELTSYAILRIALQNKCSLILKDQDFEIFQNDFIQKTDWANQSLFITNLHEIDLQDYSLDCYFIDMSLKNANLESTKWKVLRNANLEGASIKGIRLYYYYDPSHDDKKLVRNEKAKSFYISLYHQQLSSPQLLMQLMQQHLDMPRSDDSCYQAIYPYHDHNDARRLSEQYEEAVALASWHKNELETALQNKLRSMPIMSDLKDALSTLSEYKDLVSKEKACKQENHNKDVEREKIISLFFTWLKKPLEHSSQQKIEAVDAAVAYLQFKKPIPKKCISAMKQGRLGLICSKIPDLHPTLYPQQGSSKLAMAPHF